MSGLTPAARALVRAAKGREAPLPDPVRTRVHQSVLRRAAALGGAAAAASAAGTTAKAGVLGGSVMQMLASTLVGGLAGATLLVATSYMRKPRDVPAPSPPAATAAARDETREPSRALVPARSMRVDIPSAARIPEVVPLRGAHEPSKKTPSPASPVSRTEAPPPASPLATGASAELAPPAPPVATPPTPAVDDLAAQVEFLRQTHAALRAGQPDQALALLDGHGAALGTGPLAEEAGAARISALCQLGRTSEARSAISSFLSAWPRSPLSLKIQGGCSALSGEKR